MNEQICRPQSCYALVILVITLSWPQSGLAQLLPAGIAEPPRLPPVDEDRLRTFRIRKVVGDHLTLFTDLPRQPAIEELPQVFDLAMDQWCEYFGVAIDDTDSLHWHASLMQDPERFRRAGIFPNDLPHFRHGYQRRGQLWLYEQPSDYYRRHLLLHEGVHAFMNWSLGGSGPPWYMEGMAELLATHRWDGRQLQIRTFPQSKQETPEWGRIKQIKEDLQAGRGRTLPQVMAYGPQAHLEVSAYAWSWAAAVFLDTHPRGRQLFRRLSAQAADATPASSTRFYRRLQQQWPLLEHEWQLFVGTIEYGFDIEREAVVSQKRRGAPRGSQSIQIEAARGWQSTGWELAAGSTYRLTATGRYQVADQPDVWWAEPGGVTLRYHAGKPLGQLLGTLVSDEAAAGSSPLLRSSPIGLERTIRPARSGVLYLRVNDSPAELQDNRGQLEVKLEPIVSRTR